MEEETLPQEIHDFVASLLKDGTFYPSKPPHIRRHAAWAEAYCVHDLVNNTKRFTQKPPKPLDTSPPALA